jgi:hypothetical protein
MEPVKINDTTYEITLPPGDRVEIGDKDSADFKPCVRLNRWGTESSLVLAIPTDEKILPVIQNQKILWQGRDYGAEFFATTNGFKFNIILPEKPVTNVFPLDFGSDNLKFYYQPPLTEEFKNGWSEEFKRDILVTETQVTDLDGNVLVNRPENVVGSYAVYHAARGNMHAGEAEAEKYKTGKAFHWYRPLIYDSAGKTTWGILNVNPQAGIRTVTVPQEFLDNAVYPVTIDDDFGYTDVGGTDGSYTANSLRASYDTYACSGGTGTSVHYYCSSDVEDIEIVLYKSDGSVVSNGWASGNTSGQGWHQADFATPPSLDSGNYRLAWNRTGTCALYFDTGGDDNYYYVNANYGTHPDSPSWNQSSVKRQFSIYCTYTPGGGGATEKQSSDAGAGADSKASANPVAALSGAESGGGVDSLPGRDIALPEAGSGADALVSLQTPAAKTASDTGSGVDALVSLEVPQAKTSSDVGSGVEAVPVYSAALADVESGSAVEAFIARLLAAAEAGYGAEASEIGGGGLLKHLLAGELGEGLDGLTAKIEKPNKGGGMKLWT